MGLQIFKAGVNDLIMAISFSLKSFPSIFTYTMERQYFDLIGQFSIIGHNHAAFGRCQILGDVKTKTT